MGREDEGSGMEDKGREGRNEQKKEMKGRRGREGVSETEERQEELLKSWVLKVSIIGWTLICDSGSVW